MIIFYEIKKITGGLIFKITLSALLLICLCLSYAEASGADTAAYTAEQLQASYEEQMRIYIENAKRDLLNLNGVGEENDYAHGYYQTVIGLYTKASDEIRIKNGSAAGWDRLLSSDGLTVLSLAAAAVVGGVCVFEEKRRGSIHVIRPTKNGRAKTAAAKMTAVITVSVFLCALFTAAAFSVYFFGGSLSGGFAEVQTAESFRFSPYKITLIGCLLSITCGRMLASALIGALSAIFSELFGSYVMIFAASSVFAAAEYAFYIMRFTAVDVFIKNVNVFSLGGAYLYTRYYSVRLFGCAGAAETGAVLSAVLVAALSLLFVALYSLGKNLIPPVKAEKKAKIRRAVFDPSPKTLFCWEVRKNLSLRVGAVAAVCAVLICVSSFCTCADPGNTDDMIYQEYCAEYEKMPFDDALAAVSAEVRRVENGVNLRAEALEKLNGGQISYEEYSALMTEYGYCKAHELSIKRCAERAARLRGIKTPEKHEIRFVKDRTLNALLGSDFSFLFVILLTVCLSALFSREYESGMYAVMRPCKNGKNKTFLSKIAFAAAFTAVLFTVFTAVEVASCASNGAFSCASASVLSLAPAENVKADISIGTYVFIMYLLRFAAYESFALIVSSLSALTGRTMTAAALSTALVFIPYAAGKLGTVPPWADISSVMAANGVLLSADINAAAFIIPPLTSVLLTAAAYIKFTAPVR